MGLAIAALTLIATVRRSLETAGVRRRNGDGGPGAYSSDPHGAAQWIACLK